MHHQFQLVLEFRAPDRAAFASVLRAERTLDEWLQSGCMDGNEVGRDFVKICIITSSPVECFSEVMTLLSPCGISPVQACFTDLEDGENSVALWPQAEAGVAAGR